MTRDTASRDTAGKDPPNIERILFTEEQIAQRIQEVAAEITARYRGKPLKLVGVLKGSIFFLTALARQIQIPVKIDFLAISTFSNKSSAPGIVRIAPSFTHRSAMAITAVIVGKDSPIRTAAELNGKIIGVPSLSGPAKVATDKWLLKNGVDISTVKFVEVPQVTMAAAVTRGTVTAATTNEPSLTATIDEVRVLGYPYDAIGNGIQVTAWCATEDWVRTHSDLARRFVGAIHEAAVWANKPENHAASGAILLKYTPFPAELLPKMHRATYGEIFDPALMQPVLDAALDEKSIAKHIAAKELLSSVVLTR